MDRLCVARVEGARVEGTRTQAPIIELRRMSKNVTIDNWKDLALDVYDFLVALNDKKTHQMEPRRYDPGNLRG